jgi:PKD repeat protein
VDSGCSVAHEDIAANLWVNTAEAQGTTGVDDDGNGYIDDLHGWDFINGDNTLDDFDNHGTATSSAAVAVGDNGKGTAGVAYRCKVAVLKGNKFIEAAVEAFQYAVDKGFRVVNASWGSVYSDAISDAITEMNNNGVLLVCVAGNQGRDLATYSIYPACYPHDNIIVVMNTDKYDYKRDSSNWGLVDVDLAAPGTDLYLAQSWGSYGYCTGTSYSTPVVSGACALLWSRYPYLTHMQVKQLILDNIDVLYSLAGLCVTGGRLNIKKALDAGEMMVGSPEADFEADKTSGIADFTVEFTDKSSGCPTSWSWSFGDGGTSSQQNPQHTYTSPGFFTVTLTVSRDSDSDTETKTDYIEILPAGSVIADFSGTPSSGTVPLSVSFTDKSVGNVLSWFWSFGDGSTSSESNPTHVYEYCGTYTVSLTVTGAAAEDTETKTCYINVTAPILTGKSDNGGGCALTGKREINDIRSMLGCLIPFLLLASVLLIRRRVRYVQFDNSISQSKGT